MANDLYFIIIIAKSKIIDKYFYNLLDLHQYHLLLVQSFSYLCLFLLIKSISKTLKITFLLSLNHYI